MTVTNDGATILKLLEVEHPAAKILVELADLQDQEVGDGTTTVVSHPNTPAGSTPSWNSVLPSFLQVILAAELLKHAEDLVKFKIHPTSIIAGYRLACKSVYPLPRLDWFRMLFLEKLASTSTKT